MEPFVIKAIPDTEDNFPDPPHVALPKHPFTWGLVAPPGKGKTTLICNVLMKYAGYFNQINIFSPSVASDKKWKKMKEMKLLKENVALKEWIKKQKENHQEIVGGRVPTIEEEEDAFSPYLTEANFFDSYDSDKFQAQLAEQDTVIAMLDAHDQDKSMADMVLNIFDDLVGSHMFRGNKGNDFTIAMTRHRHHSLSAIIVTQAYKEWPKTIRTCLMCLSTFKIGNEMELKVIYEEFGMGLSWPEWLEVYHEAMNGSLHNFIFFNHQQLDENKQITKNFEKYLVTLRE